MVLQIDPPGQLQEFVDVLKRRRWQIIFPAAFVLSLGIAFAVIVPKKYEVETQIELRAVAIGEGTLGGSGGTKGVAANAPQQIKSMRRITEVVEDLKWPDYLTLSRADRADYRMRVMDNIGVQVPRQEEGGSAFVTITYLDVNKERAQQFLKALRGAWINQVVERDRTRIGVEYEKLLDVKSDLEKEWKKKQELRTQLRLDNDISLTQPTPGQHQQRTEDPDFDRYSRNKDRLDEVQIELDIAEETLAVRLAQLAETPPEVPKTVVVEGQSYTDRIAELTQQTLKLEQELEGIRPQHSRYEKTRRELELIYDQINEFKDLQTEGEITQDFKPNPFYSALEVNIAQLEADIARLSTERKTLNEVLAENRDQMTRLGEAYREDSELSARIGIIEVTLQEVESELQRKQQQREVITGPSGNPFTIIMEVEPPTTPSEPDPVLILVFAAVIGLALGLGGALAAEFAKNSFRTAGDITRVMVAPVLGVISPIVTRLQRRRRFFRRLAVGVASLLLIGSVLFITWAWEFEPDLLSDSLVDSIEGFRTLFL